MQKRIGNNVKRLGALAAVTTVAGGVFVGVSASPASASGYHLPTTPETPYEVIACAGNPGACPLAWTSSRAATSDTRDRFGNDGIDGTRFNAFLHSSWNARMSVTMSSRGSADTFATAHEQPITSSNPPGSNPDNRKERMDLCNNYRGREVVGNGDIFFVDQLTPVGKLEDAARKMKTDTSSADVLIPTRSCDGHRLVLVAKDNGSII